MESEKPVVVDDTTTNKSTPHADGDNEEEVYPGPFVVGIITLALCLGTFCLGLDNSIIVVAVPKITDHFHTIDDIGWYGSAYFLTTCSLQLLFGKLYTQYSTKVIFTIAMLLFELGSVICAAAPSSLALIIGRAVAGVGAAGLYSGATLIIRYTVPLVKRPAYLGIIGTMFGVSSVTGPILGGVFTDRLTWRWCFWINLPFGLLTAGVILVFFKLPFHNIQETELGWFEKIKKLDLPGNCLFIPAICCLLIAFQWAGTRYEWSNWRIIILFVASAVLLIAFGILQSIKQENATIPPRLIKISDVSAAAFFNFALGVCLFTSVYWLPIWFQAVKGSTAMDSGLKILPLLLGFVIGSLLTGVGTTVLGYCNPWMLLSTIFLAVGSGLLTTLRVDSGRSIWIGYQVILGFGTGFGVQCGVVVMQTILSDADVAIGLAIQVLAQNLGGALFVIIGQCIFENRLIKVLERDFRNVPDIKQIVHRAGATEIAALILQSNPNAMPTLLSDYNDSITKVFYVATAFGAVSVLGSATVRWTRMQ